MQDQSQKLICRIIQIREEIKHRKINLIPVDLSYLQSILHSLSQKLDSLQSIPNPNEKMAEIYLDHLLKYLESLHLEVQTWKGNLTDDQEGNLKILNSKLESLNDFLEFAPKVPLDDLFSLEEDDERWEKLKKVTEYFHRDKTEKVKKKYKNFMTQIASGQAFVSKGYEEAPGVKRLLMIGLGSMYYTFFKKKALRKTHLLYAQPRLEIAMHVWNLLETVMVKKLIKLVIKGIRFNQVFYLPRTVSGVLEEYHMIDNPQKSSLVYFNNSVKVRLLSNNRVIGNGSDLIEKVIVHVHGGGFISMSTESHQVYTNVWAKELEVPVFSVDYRLAPDFPFPAGLDDVWQAFNWLLTRGKSEFNIDPKTYVLVGDSAGGNLVLALAYKILKSGLPGPSGLVLAYPALNLNKDSCSPSLLHALEDLLVPHTFLKLCLEAYLNGILDISNPLISPTFIEDEILEHFPQTRIMVGSEDPLHDECFRFCERLLENNVDSKLSVFCGASHGGLSYSFKGGIRETREMVSLASSWMREMLKLDENE
jgi:hormone-sensitive lipase